MNSIAIDVEKFNIIMPVFYKQMIKVEHVLYRVLEGILLCISGVVFF